MLIIIKFKYLFPSCAGSEQLCPGACQKSSWCPQSRVTPAMEGWGGAAIRMAACFQHLPHGVPSPCVWGRPWVCVVPALSCVGDVQVTRGFPQPPPLLALEQSLVKCHVGLGKCCVDGAKMRQKWRTDRYHTPQSKKRY